MDPRFGERGRLTERGDRIQCHICGRYFRSLAGHVHQAHDISARQYRRRFGLSSTLGLIGSSFHQAKSKAVARRVGFIGAGGRRNAPDLQETPCPVCGDPIQHRVGEWRKKQPRTCSPKCRAKLTASKNRAKPRRVRTEERWCSVCGCLFDADVRRNQTTCDPVCKRASRIRSAQNMGAKHRWPNDDKMIAALKTRRMSAVQLSEMFDVQHHTLNAILRRLKKSGAVQGAGRSPENGRVWLYTASGAEKV